MFALLQSAAVRQLEAMINGALALDPGSRAALAELAGRSLAIQVAFPPVRLHASFGAEGTVDLLANPDCDADVTLSGSPVALAVLMAAGGDQSNVANSGVRIAGDIDILRRLSAVLAELDIDWEEALASVVGDTPAHLAGDAVREAQATARSSLTRARSGLGEFIREESGLTLGSSEAEPWFEGVRYLRADTDRLQARVNRLRQHIAERRGANGER